VNRRRSQPDAGGQLLRRALDARVADVLPEATPLEAAALPAVPVVAIASGANMNFTRVGYVAERAEVGAQREALLAVTIPERPGALLEFLASLGTRWNISLFHYRNHGAAYGRVLCGLEVPVAERGALARVIARLGFPWADETSNPAARFFLAPGSARV
jgi:threonine dehydratase